MFEKAKSVDFHCFLKKLHETQRFQRFQRFSVNLSSWREGSPTNSGISGISRFSEVIWKNKIKFVGL